MRSSPSSNGGRRSGMLPSGRREAELHAAGRSARGVGDDDKTEDHMMRTIGFGFAGVAAMLAVGRRSGRRQQGDAAAQVGAAGAVRRLLRRQGQGLLQGRGARRDDQARRPGRRARAGDRRRRRRRYRRLDAGGAGRAREGRAARQHRPAVQAFRSRAHLPRRHRHQEARGPQGPHARRLVLRQRISVPELDGQAAPQDRRLAGRGQGGEAGLQRRSAVAEAGRLHLDHDLQRVLAGDRRRLQARASSSCSSTRTRASRRSRTASM